MTMEIRYAARSDVGLLREINEDAAYAGPRLIAVADGMGGHAAGEVASAVAIAALATLDRDTPSEEDPRELLRGAIFEANGRVRDMVASDRELDGMGTTVTALLVDRTQFALAHIGDSRAYLIRAGVLTQVTRDHTLVQRLVDEGRITAAEAGVHPQRALVTNALQGQEKLDLDLSVHDLVAGDRYLLCSDGLSGVVSDATMREALLLPDPRHAVDRLVELALRGGAPDNVTCVVADVVEAAQTSALVVDGAATMRVVAGSAAEGPQAVSARAGLRDGSTAAAGDHAAGKAARLRRPGVTERAQHVRRWQRVVIATVLGAVAIAAAFGGWSYVQSQYYVGASGTDVAIFRGVHGRFAGIDLSRVTDEQRVPMTGLGEFERRRVQSGISAASLRDARDIVARLASESAPQPANPLPTEPPTAAESPSGSIEPSPSPSAGSSPSTSPISSASPSTP